jgi:hypothetical protein
MNQHREANLPKDPYLREQTLALSGKIKEHMAGLRKEDMEKKRKEFEEEMKKAS